MSPEQKTRAALMRGEFSQVAADYADLAINADPKLSTDYRLKAALLYLDLGVPERARPLLTDGSESNAQMSPRRALVNALEELQKGDGANAVTTLNGLNLDEFDHYERGLYLRTLGKAQLAASDTVALVNLLNAELFPLPLNRRIELTHLIWDGFKSNGEASLLAPAEPRNPNLVGWRSLLEETRRLEMNPRVLADALASWRLRFPTHPANDILIEEIIEQAEELSAPVRQVALLLPLDGELEGYAAAIRDGFIAMRFAENNAGLAVNIYSASGEGVRAAYAQAVKEGAQFVVGPLDKSGLEALEKIDLRRVPVLALNSLGSATIPGVSAAATTQAPVTQFGLAPEDEAVDLANRAWRDGHRRIATIVPESELGTRLSAAFKLTWEQLGGTVVEVSRYASNVPAFKGAVRRTFSLAQSEARAAELRRILSRPIIFTARARPDLDAIMLIASSTDARQIIPQFRYFGVDYLPIYSTSQVFEGSGSIRNDDDLDGITFGTMPWLLNMSERSIRETIKRHWLNRRADYDRFYAFGVDAYRLINLIPEMIREPGIVAAGATGRLSLEPPGRIRRALSWAKYYNGIPMALPE